MKKTNETPLSVWAEYWIGFPTIFFTSMKFLFVLMFGFFAALAISTLFVPISETPTSQPPTWWNNQLVAIGALSLSILSFFWALTSARKNILKKNQADWELAQRLHQAAQETLAEISRLDTLRIQPMKDRKAWKPIQLRSLPDQKVIGDITGYMSGFAFFILRASIKGQLVGSGSSLPWGEGGWVIIQKEGSVLRLAWLSNQSLLNILRGFEERIRRVLPWERKLRLPLNNMETRLAYGSHTDYALREIFRGEGPNSLTAYTHGLKAEIFYNQLAGILNNKDRPVPPLKFSGETTRPGVVLAFDVQLGENVFVLFPAQFFQEVARRMEQVSGVTLLPEPERTTSLLDGQG